MKITLELLKSLNVWDEWINFFKTNKEPDTLQKLTYICIDKHEILFILHVFLQFMNRKQRLLFAKKACELVLPFFEEYMKNEKCLSYILDKASICIEDDTDANRENARKLAKTIKSLYIPIRADDSKRAIDSVRAANVAKSSIYFFAIAVADYNALRSDRAALYAIICCVFDVINTDWYVKGCQARTVLEYGIELIEGI